MTTLEFTLTREQLEAIRTKLSSQDVKLIGDKGDISSKGVQLTFDYVAPKLSIIIVDSGHYPSFMVKHQINNWFNSNV